MPDKPSISKGMPTVEDLKTLGIAKKRMLQFADGTDKAADTLRELTDELEKYKDAAEEAEEARSALTAATEDAIKIDKEDTEGIKANLAMQKQHKDQLNKLEKTMSKSEVKIKGLNKEYTKSTSSLNNLGKGIGKVALRYVGWAAILSMVYKGLQELDSQSQQVAKHSLDLADVQGSASDQLGFQVKQLALYSTSLADARWEMAKYGFSVEQSTELVNAVMDKMRDRTLDSIDAQTKFATNVGFLSKALRIDAADALGYAQKRVEKFGGSAESATTDMADLYTTVTKTMKGVRSYKFHVGDLTKVIFEQAASLDVYELDLRALTTVMTTVVELTEQTGASQELAIKTAKNLAGIMTTDAPDWLEYLAGEKLTTNLNKAMRGMRIDLDKAVPQKARDSIIKTFMGVTGDAYKKMSERGGSELDDINKRADRLAKTFKIMQGQGRYALDKVLFAQTQATDEGLSNTYDILKTQSQAFGYHFINKLIPNAEEAFEVFALLKRGEKDLFKKKMKDAIEKKRLEGPVTAGDLERQVGSQLKIMTSAEQGMQGKIETYVNMFMSSFGPAIMWIAKHLAGWETPEETRNKARQVVIAAAKKEAGFGYQYEGRAIQPVLSKEEIQTNMLGRKLMARIESAVGEKEGVAASEAAKFEVAKIERETLYLPAKPTKQQTEKYEESKKLVEKLKEFATRSFGTDKELMNRLTKNEEKAIQNYEDMKQQSIDVYKTDGVFKKRQQEAFGNVMMDLEARKMANEKNMSYNDAMAILRSFGPEATGTSRDVNAPGGLDTGEGAAKKGTKVWEGSSLLSGGPGAVPATEGTDGSLLFKVTPAQAAAIAARGAQNTNKKTDAAPPAGN